MNYALTVKCCEAESRNLPVVGADQRGRVVETK